MNRIFFSAAGAVALFAPAFAFAQAPSGAPTSISALYGAICTIGNWFFAFVLAASMIAFIYSGYLFFSSAGGEKVNQAKKVLTYAIIGTGVAILSKTLIVVIGNLVGADVGPFTCS